MPDTRTDGQPGRLRPLLLMRAGNLLVLGVLALWFLVWPGLRLAWDLTDPALRLPNGNNPRAAWRVHRALAPRLATWANARVDTQAGAAVPDLLDVPVTEWPMFTCVFYLGATAALQAEWDRHPRGPAPREYARDAIAACLRLITDPATHTWVRMHWGDDYLHRENVFFRGMLIQGLTDYERVTGDRRHHDLLRDQVETLARALDAAPHGLLHDYPGECYPLDVLAAVWCIRRADPLLGTDHRAFAAREWRAFSGARLDACGLLAYEADVASGRSDSPSRGIGNSYALLYAPDLYPERAAEWYALYTRHFWQERIGAAGYREYPKDMTDKEWLVVPDSGPVVWGFSPAGNAYAVGAARANGRFDQAWPLSAQVLAAAWPLPNGRWLGARILSAAARGHAPYLGEANLLFLFTRQPVAGLPAVTGGRLPPIIAVAFLFYLGLGGLFLWLIGRQWRRLGRADGAAAARIPRGTVQFTLWLTLYAAVPAVLAWKGLLAAFAVLLAAQFLPRPGRPDRAPAALGTQET
ncbi:MAG: hypothetical protein WC708_02890 [Lentisphaeria bacterium]